MSVTIFRHPSSYMSLSVASLMLLLAGCSATDCDPSKQDEMFAQMACSTGGYQKRTNALTNERDTQQQATETQNTHLTSINQKLAALKNEIARLRLQIAAEKAQREALVQKEADLQAQYEQAKARGDDVEELAKQISFTKKERAELSEMIEKKTSKIDKNQDEINNLSASAKSL